MKNRKMNKKLIFVLTTLATISYFGTNLDVKEFPETKTTAHSIQAEQNETLKRNPGTTPVQLKEETKIISVAAFDGTPHDSLPQGFVFLDDVHAIDSKDYREAMGEKVEEKLGQTFFVSEDKKQDYNRVVFDKRNKKLYLVSSIIKIENVDETLRNKVLDKGLEEHYYNEDLKIMYVQSTQEDLLKTHEDLKHDENLVPKLEIIRGYHRPI